MIRSLLSREISFSTVLMDSWYAVTKTLLWLDDLGKTYYCPIKSNRLLGDAPLHPYVAVKDLVWTDAEFISGKIVKVKGFPKSRLVKLFRIV
jgi:hypothetical protein